MEVVASGTEIWYNNRTLRVANNHPNLVYTASLLPFSRMMWVVENVDAYHRLSCGSPKFQCEASGGERYLTGSQGVDESL
jgi:hypothetical protein